MESPHLWYQPKPPVQTPTCLWPIFVIADIEVLTAPSLVTVMNMSCFAKLVWLFKEFPPTGTAAFSGPTLWGLAIMAGSGAARSAREPFWT
jgi:hypothetical protein